MSRKSFRRGMPEREHGGGGQLQGETKKDIFWEGLRLKRRVWGEYSYEVDEAYRGRRRWERHAVYGKTWDRDLPILVIDEGVAWWEECQGGTRFKATFFDRDCRGQERRRTVHGPWWVEGMVGGGREGMLAVVVTRSAGVKVMGTCCILRHTCITVLTALNVTIHYFFLY